MLRRRLRRLDPRSEPSLFNRLERTLVAPLQFLAVESNSSTNRIAERKLRDWQARREQIVSAAGRIAEQEGWPNVTVRRLSDEIS